MSSTPTVPYHGAYWVEPDRVLAGPYPLVLTAHATEKRLRALLDAGIDTLVDLTEEGELEAYAPLIQRLAAQRDLRVRHVRLPIRDMTVPTPEHLRAILDTIDSALVEDRTVYVHCWGGIGRTGTAVGAWLVRHGLSGEDALRQIIALRGGRLDSPQTPEQAQMVRSWPEGGNLT